MKSRDAALRLKRFDAEEKRRKVADLESMIREFEQMASDLDRQIATEEERTGVKDDKHFAYSTFARAAAQRRDNLKTSVADLRAKLDAAIVLRDEAVAAVDAAAGDDRALDRNRRGDRGSDARVG